MLIAIKSYNVYFGIELLKLLSDMGFNPTVPGVGFELRILLRLNLSFPQLRSVTALLHICKCVSIKRCVSEPLDQPSSACGS